MGDKNTRFFQITTNNRFKRNLVGSVKVNGRLVEDPGQIKKVATNHFQNNFKKERRIRPALGGVFNRKRDLEVARHLRISLRKKKLWRP